MLLNQTDHKNTQASVNSLLNENRIQEAFDAWRQARGSYPSELAYFRAGTAIVNELIKATDYAIKTITQKSKLTSALEVSLLAKLQPTQYELFKRYLKNQPHLQADLVWNIVLETHDENASVIFEDLIILFETIDAWQLSKIFRYPKFANSAKLFVNFLMILVDNTSRLKDISSKGLFNIIVISYAVAPRYLFNEYIRLLNTLSPSDNLISDTEKAAQTAVVKIRQAFTSKQNVTLPSSRQRKKLKVALCISGQLRGYRAAWPTWKHLQLCNHEVDVYVNTWKQIGRRLPDPEVAGSTERVFSDAKFAKLFNELMMLHGSDKVKEIYPNFFAALTQSESVSSEGLKKFYGRYSSIVIEDDDSDAFRGYSNFDKMYYKITQGFKQAEASGKNYDLFIRMRPDRELKQYRDNINWWEIAERALHDKVVFTEERAGLRENLIVGDQMLVCSQEAMQSVKLVWQEFKEAQQSGRWPYSTPKVLTGHTNLAYHLLYSGFFCECFPARSSFGALLNLEKIDNEALLKMLSPDLPNGPRSHIDHQIWNLLNTQ